jgi:hypothetical protein
MVLKTPQDLLTLVLKDCGATGVGQTPRAEDLNDAFDTAIMMLGQWNRKRWLVYHLVDVVVPSTGAGQYTLGPGGDVQLAVRPDRVEAAFLRQLMGVGFGGFIFGVTPFGSAPPVDYPMRILQSREDYNRIALKSLQSFTRSLFYDNAWPLGVLHPYPIPQASLYEIHLSLKETLTSFPSLTTVINLPDEYFGALFYNLVLRVGVRYPISRDQTMLDQWETVKGLAKDSLNVLRGANTQIAALTMPSDLLRQGKYNIYSDT